MDRSPFETARTRVEEWLDQGEGSRWAKREPRRKIEQGAAWDIELGDAAQPVNSLRLVLPPDFPASPCEFYVDRRYFLSLPHVEADGHVCLGLQAIPNDYEDPVDAIVRGLRTLRDQLLAPASDPVWVEAQFRAECASYWVQHCLARRQAPGCRPIPLSSFVDMRDLNRWSMGIIAAYVPASSARREPRVQVATTADGDPNQLAQRHGWAKGTLVRGDALFVRLPSDAAWTPATWPRSFGELNSLVVKLTENEFSLADHLRSIGWLAGVTRKRPEQRQVSVMLAQDPVVFGYQVFMPAMPRLQAPAIEPMVVTRIDPDWVLARDHQRDLLLARRQKRVLLVGAGSLGSPLAVALARSGIGLLDIVDSQRMEVENTGRHALGMDSAGQGKALALARRLEQEVPGLRVTGHWAEFTTWAMRHVKPGMYDLIVEATAESSVRTFMSSLRAALFGGSPIVHAWVEPLCSAGHVVLTQPSVPWPVEDPADRLVNASDLSAADTRIDMPACSSGFHPYGAADIQLVAAFAAERAIGVLDDLEKPSTVWSWVRSSAFFAALPMAVSTRAIVPPSGSSADSATTTRALEHVLLGRED